MDRHTLGATGSGPYWEAARKEISRRAAAQHTTEPRTLDDVTEELKEVLGDSTRGAEVHRLTEELLRLPEEAKC